MAAPQRSQTTASPAGAGSVDRCGDAATTGFGVDPGSGMRRIIAELNLCPGPPTIVPPPHNEPMDHAAAREQMVEQQIAARGVSDLRVLAAMRAVPRHCFVPAAHQSEAYADRPLPIAEGQTISQPYIVAVMTAALEVNPADRVLEVGTGSGYQAAVLAQLSAQVVSVERHAALATEAARRLRDLGIDHVTVVVGDGSEGWPAGAPYDRILVTAGAPEIPDTLVDQLAAGGRLVIPVGPAGLQHLTIVDRVDGGTRVREADACVFVPLIGRHGWADR